MLFLTLLVVSGNCNPMVAQQGSGIANVAVQSVEGLLGRGEKQALLLHFNVVSESEMPLKGLVFDFFKTDLTDVAVFDLYATDTLSVFDERRVSSYRHVVSFAPDSMRIVKLGISDTLRAGDNHYWLTCNVSATATEGRKVYAVLRSVYSAVGEYAMTNEYVLHGREIVLCRSVLFRPGDYGSANYRIPAVITASDGALVALTDRRKNNDLDLPQDIDVVCRRSTDGGITWSEPLCVAQGTGYGKGFGDAALVQADDEGGLMTVFCGGTGLWASTSICPQCLYYALSRDNGVTWSEPVDFTPYVYGVECRDTIRKQWYGGFCASGNGLRLPSGRLMFVLTVRENKSNELSDYVIFTDDTGQTWQVSERAALQADEAKLVALNDGRLLMSIRCQGNRRFGISSDGGMTWTDETLVWNDLTAPACNGDMIRYPVSESSDLPSLLLQSLPFGTERSHVTVYASRDEGVSWPISRCMVPYASAYSSLCVLPDGTIGLYVEEGEGGYSMVFYRFSPDWLMGEMAGH